MTQREFDYPSLSVLLDEFKSHIRVTSNDLDSELREKLLAAVESVEHHIGSIVLRSDFVRTVSFANVIYLKGPVLSVEAVEVDDVALSSGYWYVKGEDALVIADSVTGTNAKITYSAGRLMIPYDMKAAVFMRGATLFNNPTDSVETLPKASTNLLRAYRKYGLHGEQD